MAGQISLTRDQYLDSIRQLIAAANALAERYDLNQLTWQPEAGERWNILECLDHIVVSSDLYLDSMERAASDARAGGAADVFRAGGAPSTWFTRTMEPPPAKKVPAPGGFRPRPTLNPEGILPQYRKTMDRVVRLVASTSGRDLNSIRFRHPLFSPLRFTVASGLLVIAAHGRRHLWQAEQVAANADFPKATSCA